MGQKFHEMINGDRPVLVDFFATWCGPCKMMQPVLEELKAKIGDRAHIIKIDIDSPVNREIATRYNVRSVPTLIIFRYGETVWRASGITYAPELEKILLGQ